MSGIMAITEAWREFSEIPKPDGMGALRLDGGGV
jgi:hypothetical protein